jgi:transcription antitermination factor NusB
MSSAESQRRSARRKAFEILFELEQHPGLTAAHAIERNFTDPDALEAYASDEDAEGYVVVPASLGEGGGFQLSPRAQGLRRFCSELIEAVEQHKESIDRELAKHPQHWSFERIGTSERALLRLAVAEMAYIGTAYKVVINEVLDLAKDYTAEEAVAFMNGILGAVVRNLSGLRESASTQAPQTAPQPDEADAAPAGETDE